MNTKVNLSARESGWPRLRPAGGSGLHSSVRFLELTVSRAALLEGGCGRGELRMFREGVGASYLSVNGPLDHKTEQAPNFAMTLYVSTLDERSENPYKNTNTSQLL